MPRVSAVTGTSPASGDGEVQRKQGELEFEGVWQYFATAKSQSFLAVRDISLTVDPGEFVCIIGPSGCGKSTLLNMVAGLLRPTRGQVRYRGRPVGSVNTTVGYITQQDHLMPWRTIEKNVGLALEVRHVPRAERRERVASALKMVGLEHFGGSYPSELSGGMRKRAALARVLVYEPDTLLMDEPFGALDAQLRLVMQRELLKLWEQRKKTVLFVTHDLEEAILLADTIVVFGASPGHVVHVERPNLPRPRELTELRSTEEFRAIWARLWALLEGQLSADMRDGAVNG